MGVRGLCAAPRLGGARWRCDSGAQWSTATTTFVASASALVNATNPIQRHEFEFEFDLYVIHWLLVHTFNLEKGPIKTKTMNRF